MAGIYGIASPNQSFGKNIYKHFYSSEKPGILNEEYSEKAFVYGRSTLNSLENDRFLIKKDDLIIGLEGFCYHSENDFRNWVFDEYRQAGVSFVEKLEGQFCGFIYDQSESELHIFTDHLSTKPLYFFHDKEKKVAFFSSELKAITKSSRAAGFSITPDSDGFRCLLTCGYMLGDLTPIKEVRKLPYGSITTVDLNTFSIEQKKYFSIEKHPQKGNKQDFIKGINERILDAVQKEWGKDVEYSRDHITLLSGGLDSRVNAMMGAGFADNPIQSLTFSKPDTPDQKIAARIANDLGFSHRFISMGNGDYLAGNEYEFVKANDGLVGFYGAAHQQHALEQVDFSGKGVLHTGQIGDVLFGSFTLKNADIKDAYRKLFFNADPHILSKIETLQKMKTDKFDGADVEVFSLEHRQINGTMNGDRCCSHIADSASPFYNKELLKFCLSIPDRFKYKEAIYLDWMNECQPELASYKWAATEAKPSNDAIQKTLGFKNRLQNYLLRKAGLDKKNMNPFEDWYRANSVFSKSLDKVFENGMPDGLDEELRNDIIYCYNQKSVTAKMLAVTAILSYKLHFED
ncbi:asparagine synthase-related protein [Gracilimonas sp. BCB1]|uniref:asparagine synthase-related protein n=1 Tax=Gracilimonas sp. BCB1 TaxID=3152362 RepID=UPI0032D91B67